MSEVKVLIQYDTNGDVFHVTPMGLTFKVDPTKLMPTMGLDDSQEAMGIKHIPVHIYQQLAALAVK